MMPENSTPSSRRSYRDNIASMAWGARDLISTQVHRLDAWSPLVPPDWWVEAYYRRKRGDAPRKTSVVDDAASFADFAEYAYRYPAPLRRASDAEAGYRTSRRCKICGQGFETIRDHLRGYTSMACSEFDSTQVIYGCTTRTSTRTNLSTARSRRRTTPR